MELCFEKKSTNIFAGRLHMVKSSAETVEAVVPDTNDDIARVASLQTMLLLKGKDISARGITVRHGRVCCISRRAARCSRCS